MARRKVFPVAGQQRQAMHQGRCGDQRISEAEAMAQAQVFQECDRLVGDCRCQRQALCAAHRQTALYRPRFLAVAEALQQLHPVNGGNRQHRQGIQTLAAAGLAAQMPDQHIDIHQHAHSSLREPSLR
jgi:hypothetical protein